jgi:hypothetical protein
LLMVSLEWKYRVICIIFPHEIKFFFIHFINRKHEHDNIKKSIIFIFGNDHRTISESDSPILINWQISYSFYSKQRVQAKVLKLIFHDFRRA